MKRVARMLANEYQSPSGKEGNRSSSHLERGSVKSTATGVLKEVNRNVWPSETSISAISANTKIKGSAPSQRGSQFHSTKPLYYAEPEQLENLVYRKEKIIGSLEHNENLIEEKIGMLAAQKKTIREEQNALLRELEDLGLKLKDFEGNSLNLKYCTVISPYCNRFGQQVLARLRAVCDSLSDKETRAEIVRAIQSIQSLREKREENSVELCALDLGAAGDNEAAQADKVFRLEEERNRIEHQLAEAQTQLAALVEDLKQKSAFMEVCKQAIAKKQTKGQEVGAVKVEIEEMTKERARLD